ncbi:methyltransferase type 12 domain-containing protein [Cavenderia fasciculata]|uniref:Methyltransferase type 12 domain-containing protein n=1 Tax=Cavenderia fasciculata TaxID=261658 RepID=F4PU76_CACFS|nr:methyltransferase type 12 domain-containing protein [Cavenderia fasciculata]EGG21002.1 methyltransferase type 12 domain-containing protein [Cavenderia fasciculata]|eukprot:XP_004358852.1 methyltransferase type 12 domain-containing protein [Cavenderia fasciculata]
MSNNSNALNRLKAIAQQQANKSSHLYGDSIVKRESLQSNDSKLITQSLNKLIDWINNNSNTKSALKDLDSRGIYPSMFQLFNHYDLEIVRLVVRAIKIVALKDAATNEILRSLDGVHLLEQLLEQYYDAEILNDAATAIECLRRCAPYSVRGVGFGKYSEQTGTFQWYLEFYQLHFDDVGVAWRVWDGGIGLAKWVLDNPSIFEGKDVLELGSGVGVCGIAAGLISKNVLVTDYTDKIIQALQDNVKRNMRLTSQLKNVTVQALDWVNDDVPSPFGYEVIIGSEVIYDVKLVEALANVIYLSLTPNGTFYTTCATVREGIPEFIKAMQDRDFNVEQTNFPSHYIPDTKFDVYFFKCTKKNTLLKLQQQKE